MNAALSRPPTIMLVAAEASGDILGAELAAALRRRLGPGVRFVGVGGAHMAEQGVASPFDIAELSILGIFEGVRAYPRVRRRVRDTLALAARERPDIAVLIDSWGFTLRVAQGLRKLDPSIRRVKYVGPQVWASRPGRAKTLARAVDHLLTIHGFDAPWFEREGLATTFVGNSTLARDVSAADPGRLRAHIAAAAQAPILLVLPGSRPSEVARMLPPFATLFNIAADAAVAPEFIQAACTGEALAAALAVRLDDAALRGRQIAAQFAALEQMGRDPTLVPAERAADAVLKVLEAAR